MPRLRLTLAYQGTRYAGWQLQARRDGSCPQTVQGMIERCVATIVGTRIPVHGAGRTDSGVHAEGQVCHLDLPPDSPRVDWQQALNVQLPHDIRIIEAVWTDEQFHARRSALKKRYAYSLWMHRSRALPRIAPFVWSTPALDPQRMLPALPHLIGRHDFASFQNSGAKRAATVRTLHAIRLAHGTVANIRCPDDWPVLSIIFEGDGFLKQMVRNLTGLLVWIAQGKVPAEAVPDILNARQRRALPSPSAPAQGLTLMEVVYPDTLCAHMGSSLPSGCR